MVQNIRFHAVAQGSLPFKQLSILYILFSVYVKLNQSILMYRNHVIEAEDAVLSAIEFYDVFAGLNICMIWFRRFHWHKIFVATKAEHDTNIRTPCSFVVLNSGIPAIQKPDIVIAHLVYAKSFHIFPSLSIYEEWRDRVAYLAIFKALLPARAIRFFKSQLTVWANRFFKVQFHGMDFPL